MIMFRAMGVVHILAGSALVIAQSIGCNMGSGNTSLIIASQLIGGVIMAIVGCIFKV